MISLRDVTPEDKDMIRNWRNLPEVRKYMYTDHEISPEEHERWFQGIASDPTRRYWIIVLDDEDVGLVSLYDIDARNMHCYWGWYVAKPVARGRGIGTFVEYSMLRHVFDDMCFQKLCSEVLASNRQVIDMHETLGFAQEGLYRRHVRKGGEFVDVVALAMLREEWEARKPEIEERLRSKGLIS